MFLNRLKLSIPPQSIRSFVMFVMTVFISSCALHFDVKSQAAPILPHLDKKEFTSYDGDVLGYEKWISPHVKTHTVIIGVHGISGHAGDYDNLGQYLIKHSPGVSLYAAETRGQGMDPKTYRRGDILHAKDWYRDLYTFTRLVRKKYPKAKIIWFGESMGSLIVLHAYNQTPPGDKKPDGIVLSSPIVNMSSKLPSWKYSVARVSAAIFPRLRISLESLANDDKPHPVTKDNIHKQQAAKNPWYIKRYTLRLLLALSQMSEALPDEAEHIDCPVLVLHGGKDIFTSDASVKKWFAHFPASEKNKLLFYPSSYHLLMYDHEREKIFSDVVKWLKKVN